MRSAIISIGVALLPVLLALFLWPATARAGAARTTRHAGAHVPMGQPVPGQGMFLLPHALSGAVSPGLAGTGHTGWHGMPGWLNRSLSSALSFHTPSSSTSMLAMWLTGGLHRFLSIFLPTGRGPLAVPSSGLALLTVAPVAGVESSGYGYRRDPINRRRKFHKGVDYRAERGTPVYAAGPGVVQVATRQGGYGRLVVISHGNGVETRYAHLHRIEVKKGELVAAGARIGTVGSTGRTTGPHLHFEVRRDGEPMDPNWVLGWNLEASAAVANAP